MAACPACGQTLRVLPQGVHLSPLELKLYNILKRAGDNGVFVNDLSEKIYRDYASGGPINANKIVHILKFQINKKLKGTGQKIRNTSKGRGALYILEAK